MLKSDERNLGVDFLRAVAVLVMFYLHTTALYLNRKNMLFLWDTGHFVVPLFVFCSGYVFFLKTGQWNAFSLKDYFSFLKKRLLRLLIPYYVFLFFVFVSLFFFQPQLLTTGYLLQSIFLVGGVDISWLILLFLVLTIIQPPLAFAKYRFKTLFYVFFAIAASSSFVFIFWKPEINYRWYNWLPWSALLIYPAILQGYVNSRKYMTTMALAGTVVFAGSLLLLSISGRPIGLYLHKYPPDAYYLAYGWTILHLIYLIVPFKKFMEWVFGRVVLFISRNSYNLFFVHWLVLYYLVRTGWQNRLPWPLAVLSVTCLSLFIQTYLKYFIK
jgi:peptidoglycan/LPS O-acetylase OafA/YrhL